MPRRVKLPGANELFRGGEPPAPKPAATTPALEAPAGGSGRVRHDEKITVYVSTDELIALDQARLTLKGSHRITADRGRIVREAIHLVLADLAARGDDSDLVKRLSQP